MNKITMSKRFVGGTHERTGFIQKICGYAISDMKENGILASVTIAQAILESSWGTSELAEES